MKAAPTVALAEIMASKSGSVDPSKYPDEIFELYSIPAFDSGMPELVAGRQIGSAKQVVRLGDVLLSRIVPHIRRSWVVQNANSRRTIASGEWIVFRSDRIHPSFLRHVLVGDPFHSQFMRTVSGVGGSLLRARPAYVAKIEIPFPPLAEQRRIAEILDRAEALRAKRRAALAQLDTLTQSIFLDLFGDPGTNSRGWPINHLVELCREISDIDHKMPKSVEDGVPFISAKDLTDDGRLSFENVKRISQGDFDRLARKSKPERGDIIYSRIGANLGKARLVDVDFEFLASYSCCTIKPNTEAIDPVFLCSVLDSPFMLKQAHRGVRAIAVPDLGLNEIKNFRVPVPPKELQVEFRQRLAAVRKLKAAHHASQVHLDSLATVLQHGAFRGEL